MEKTSYSLRAGAAIHIALLRIYARAKCSTQKDTAPWISTGGGGLAELPTCGAAVVRLLIRSILRPGSTCPGAGGPSTGAISIRIMPWHTYIAILASIPIR